MRTLQITLATAVAVALLAMTATAYAGSSTSWTTELGNFWHNGQISDTDFLSAVQYLVDQGHVKVVPQIVIQEVQAQSSNNDDLGNAVGVLQNKLDVLANEFGQWQKTFNDRPIFDEIKTLRIEIKRVDDKHGDAILVLQSDPVDQNPDIDWEKRYNELWDLYDRLSLRVVELEKEAGN